ncbi:MAG: TfuA-like protein [Anderseniella sp.]
MKPVVFLGPSLQRIQAAAALDANYKPPARQGDVLRSVVGGATAIGLVDGFFERVPSVWHKEILFALSHGVKVYGAASMGALRACELHSFGMIGVGDVFRSYHEGELEDDDEVAIEHAPAEAGYIPLSEAMVNIRATVRMAVTQGIIKESVAANLTVLAKNTHYKLRTYPTLIEQARAFGLDNVIVDRFEKWLVEGKVDQKKIDALDMLATIASDQKLDFKNRNHKIMKVEDSVSWRRARDFVTALNRRDVPRWHFAMLNDDLRSEAYDNAIRKAVRPGDVVLDIGTGSGLLAMLAARAGASHVYACESVGSIAQKARDIIAANQLSDRITVLQKRSTDLVVGTDMPGQADVLVSEIVDRNLLGEGIVPTLEHALRTLTKPDAKIIPQSGRLLISAFECDDLFSAYNVDVVAGFDVSLFNEFSLCGSNTVMNLSGYTLNRLSEPEVAFDFCFAQPDFAAQKKIIQIKTARPGMLHGMVCWFELFLDDDNTVDNRPGRPGSSWSHEVYLLTTPRPLQSDETVQVRVSHDMTSFQFELADDD